MVLLVDDEPSILRAFGRMLRNAGLEVVATGSAEAALALLESAEFDALVTDHDMPGRNGVWLLGEARERRPRVRRVLMSGRVVEKLESYLESGLAQSFVEKPADASTLIAALEGKSK